jgi:hypothetical protein
MMHNTQQRGSSLLYVILISGLLLVIIFSISSLSLLELANTQVDEQSQQAFYVAEAGLERSLYELQKDPVNHSTTLTDSVGPTGVYNAYIGIQPPADTTLNTTLTSFDVTLDPLQFKQINLYDPEHLSTNLFDLVSGDVTATVTCADGCSADPVTNIVPGLEVSVLSFDPNTVGSFDVSKLLDSGIERSFDFSQDESRIGIKRNVENDVANIQQLSLKTVEQFRYVLQLKALRKGATYHILLSSPIKQINTIPLSSFGEVNGRRRAIEMVLNTNLVPKSLFDYAIFENQDLQKFAK